MSPQPYIRKETLKIVDKNKYLRNEKIIKANGLTNTCK